MDPQPPEDEQEDVKDTEAAKRYLSPAYIRVFGGNPEGKGYICPRYQRERKLVTTKNRELDKVFDVSLRCDVHPPPRSSGPPVPLHTPPGVVDVLIPCGARSPTWCPT